MSRPAWLTSPTDLAPIALSYWKLYAPALWQAGYVTAECTEPLKLMCRLLAAARVASDAIEQEGATIRSNAGTVKSNPAFAELLRVADALKPLLREFNLDNASDPLAIRAMRF